MKELQSNTGDNVSSVKEQHLKKTTFGGTLKIQPGHTAFEFDLAARDISPAEFEEVNIDLAEAEKGNLQRRKKLIMRQGCLYCSALNKKSAKKKFMKMLAAAVK